MSDRDRFLPQLDRRLRRAGLSVAAAVLVALSGCAGVREQDASREAAGRSESGTLVVEQRFGGDAAYIEGSYSYVRIPATSGGDGVEITRVHEERLSPLDDVPGTQLALEPGDYRFESWQRPCSGYCGGEATLGPATDHCTTDFQMRSGAEQWLRIEVRPGEGCEIDLE